MERNQRRSSRGAKQSGAHVTNDPVDPVEYDVAEENEKAVIADQQTKEGEEEMVSWRRRTPSTSQPRSSKKRPRRSESQDTEEGEETVQARYTADDNRRSGVSAFSGLRPSGNVPRKSGGFFHDLAALRPLRVRIGVCPLPGKPPTSNNNNNNNNNNNSNRNNNISSSVFEDADASSTALLLGARKFLTLPEENGGKDIIGWAAALPSVSVELPGEGVYRNASVSVSVMLPP